MVDFQKLTTPSDSGTDRYAIRVAVIAITSLTDNEAWTPIHPGELLVFQDGLPLNLTV